METLNPCHSRVNCEKSVVIISDNYKKLSRWEVVKCGKVIAKIIGYNQCNSSVA
jgi:hypothetical protein